MHHFHQTNKLRHMSKRKTFTEKKHYLQAIINSTQNAIDVVAEHSLTGEVSYC